MNVNKSSVAELEVQLQVLEAENQLLREQITALKQPADTDSSHEPPRSEEQAPAPQQVAAVNTLMGGIAHDFNNLLAAIMGNVFLLLRQTEEGPQKDRLRDVQKMCLNAADMTAQMLIFSRRGIFKREALQLSTFMHDFSKICQMLLPQDICLEIGTVADDLVLQVDASQFQQMLMNLVANAQEALAGQKNPSIGISVEAFAADSKFFAKHPVIESKELVCISIIDNGCGIPLELQQQIFTAFFTTKKAPPGTGLGLSMVADAVKRLHGVIELNSIPGQGTILRLFLPCERQETAERRNDSREELVYGQGELLLLADDDVFVRDSHKDVLVQLGYRVLAVADGCQAVEAFTEYPQVVMAILDVTMPKLDGVAAAQQMRQIRPELPVLFLTGYADRVLAKQTLPAEAEMLYKPASMPELSRRVQRLLERLDDQQT
jgi:signal transduction histidine kinase/ActR/RegA family two-component response regulator